MSFLALMLVGLVWTYLLLTTLISYDLPWSAGKLKQREARIDRISSEWDEITLIKMVMEGSIEEWMLDVLNQKIGMAGRLDRR